MNKKHDEIIKNLEDIANKIKGGYHVRGALLIKFDKDQITTYNYIEDKYNYIILNDEMKLNLIELCDTWYEELLEKYEFEEFENWEEGEEE